MAPPDDTTGAKLSGPRTPPASEADPLAPGDLSQWTKEAEQKLGSSSTQGIEDSVEIGGMTLGRAAQLVRAGRLRLVLPVDDPAHWPRGKALLASALVRKGPSDAPASGPAPLAFAIELAIPRDEAGLALKDAVTGLYSRLSAIADGPVRLEEISEHSGEPPLGGARPSAEPTDVLWWAHPASKWTRAESVLVGVRLEAAK